MNGGFDQRPIWEPTDMTARTEEIISPDGQIEDASVADLVRRASDDVKRLVQAEIALARAEMMRKGKQAGLGGGLLGAGAGLVYFAVAVFIAAAVLGIAVALPGWAAALIVGGGLVAMALVLALAGRIALRRSTPLVPREAIQSVKLDIDEVKGGIRR
jgi:hypothetical protein